MTTLDTAPPAPIAGGVDEEHSRPRLVTESIRSIAERVENAPPPRFLARPVWPEDAYGVIAAENKAGKSWAALDLAITVAAGARWLGVYACDRPGPVLAYWGEATERKTMRRARAIAEHHDVGDVAELPLQLAHRVPHLASTVDLIDIEADIERHQPVLVVLDPLYLAARGSKGPDLFAGVGAALEPVQQLCQQAGSALAVIHHFNQSGRGTGRERMSGAGSAEWGRVLVSMAVDARRTVGATSEVTLSVELVGDEMPDLALTLRRRVWTEDPDDVRSPMHYELEPIEAVRAEERILPDEKPAIGRVLAIVISDAEPLTVSEIGDRLAVDQTGKPPLKARTIQDALKRLDDLGRVHRKGSTDSGATRWGLQSRADAHAQQSMADGKWF